jgi:hypothetical protein
VEQNLKWKVRYATNGPKFSCLSITVPTLRCINKLTITLSSTAMLLIEFHICGLYHTVVLTGSHLLVVTHDDEYVVAIRVPVLGNWD